MPSKGYKSQKKIFWVGMFSEAIEVLGKHARQDDLISWVGSKCERTSHPYGDRPADSTCKGYIKDLLYEIKRSWLDEPWSIGFFYSQDESESLLPYESLQAVLLLWRRLVIGQLDMTCRHAVWIARLRPMFHPDAEGDLQLFMAAKKYSAGERAASTSGVPFYSQSLDAGLAFIQLPESGDGRHAYRRALNLLRISGELPSEELLIPEEESAYSLDSSAVVSDLMLLMGAEVDLEISFDDESETNTSLVNMEPWKSELFFVTWRVMYGRKLRKGLDPKHVAEIALSLRQLIADENWIEYDKFINDKIEVLYGGN